MDSKWLIPIMLATLTSAASLNYGECYQYQDSNGTLTDFCAPPLLTVNNTIYNSTLINNSCQQYYDTQILNYSFFYNSTANYTQGCTNYSYYYNETLAMKNDYRLLEHGQRYFDYATNLTIECTPDAIDTPEMKILQPGESYTLGNKVVYANNLTALAPQAACNETAGCNAGYIASQGYILQTQCPQANYTLQAPQTITPNNDFPVTESLIALAVIALCYFGYKMVAQKKQEEIA